MEYEASSVTFSKKLANGHHSSFSGSSVYDGVFASPAKKKFGAPAAQSISSRAEEYREIFGGSSEASSIPFLDVPELSEQKVSVDVRSSELDYSKVFGGGEDSSFAVRFEELPLEPNTWKKSEEEWMRSGRLSPSEASESSGFSDGNYVRSPEASHQAFNGVKQFNMSYNKINNGNANGAIGTNGTTHIAQLNAVRGYACLIDEHKTEDDKPVKSNTYHGVMEEGNNFVKSSGNVVLGETVKQTSGADLESQSSPNWFKSYSMGKPSEGFESGRGIPRLKVSSSASLPRNFNFRNGNDGTDRNGGSTMPYFEEEVDTNSVAATSAAALEKAIEVAQARLKVAKEIMERKKAGLKNGGKLSFTDGLTPEERKEGSVAFGVNRPKKKKTHEPNVEVGNPICASFGIKENNPAGPRKVTENSGVRERVRSSENGETSWKEPSSQACHSCEEAEGPEVEQFYDVETGENWSPTVEVEIPHVSATTRKQSVTGPGQVTEVFEVHKFFSGAKETDHNKVTTSQVDHAHEKAGPAEAAEQFYEFEEVARVQSVDESVKKKKIVVDKVFEKPQQVQEGPKPVVKEDKPEEVEKRIKILNGIDGASDCSEDGGKPSLDVEVFNHEKNEQKQRPGPNHIESGEIVEAFDENDKSERNIIEFLEPLNNGKLLEVRGLDNIERMKKELTTSQHVESERKGDEDCRQEENEKEESHAHGLKHNEKKFRKRATWQISPIGSCSSIKQRLNGFHLGQELSKLLSHDHEPEGTEKIFEGYVSQNEENDNTQEKSAEWVEIGRTSTESDNSEGHEHKTKTAAEEARNHGSNLGEADDYRRENQKPVMLADDDETLKAFEELPSCRDNGSGMIELSKGLLQSDESVEEEYDVEKTDILNPFSFSQGFELTKMIKPLVDRTKSVLSDKNDASDDEGRIGTNYVQKPRDEPASQIIHDSREHTEELAPELESVEEYTNDSEVGVSPEDDESKTECSGKQGWVDSGTNMKAPQFSESSEGEEEGSVGLDDQSESSTSKEKDHENPEEILTSQHGEVSEEGRKESVQNAPSADSSEEKGSTANKSSEKEAELKKTHTRRVDKAKEREREIEKGRMAVERAVREARERAFAEARERAAAEKAATEARQRANSEAREKLRTSGELNTKPVSDKAKEAKLKAERAAVERATAEARGRALEKAMSSKAASQARKQNPQHKGPSSTTTSRYPYHSNDNGSNSTERDDAANGESAQRCKARSERHQRISERAEKALAEKSRRDLLAQKEQAERNRLAETLDIEVKRWSSGKEGNLRALLSTLQYILGPDSRWQPIPLTDIITTAAVKKAYRKATLFVHPDKLQQRGANIQQKYTCEKVFDLLKEAWNKFNVEER